MSSEIENLIMAIDDKVAPSSTDRDVVFEGINLHVKAGVFDPSKGRSTRKMAAALDRLPLEEGMSVLEIGTGAGVLPILLSQRTNKLQFTATDINPAAVESARINFLKYGISADLKCADLFNGVFGNYDLIIFNAPTFHPCIKEKPVKGMVALWDQEGSLKQKFLEGAAKHLKEGGRIVFMYSRYQDYNSLAQLDLSGYSQHRLFVEENGLSEAGVALLEQVKPIL